jgi:hypothetical protein
MKKNRLLVLGVAAAALIFVTVISSYKHSVSTSKKSTRAIHSSNHLSLESRNGTDSSATEGPKTQSLLARSAAQDTKVDESVLRRPTREDLLNRRLKVRSTKNAGRYSEALAEYLWLFDVGALQLRHVDRRVGLLNEIAELGVIYPPALEALRERIAMAAKLLEASPGDSDALQDLVALNKVLKQEHRTIALYDGLAPQDPLRSKLAAEIFEPLVDAGRYEDAMSGTTYARIKRSFENRIGKDDRGTQAWHDLVVQQGLKTIEALAGIGDIEHAAELSNRLLSYSNKEQTKEMLRRALARAGKSESIEIR